MTCEFNEATCLRTLPNSYCFICGEIITDNACNIIGTETPFFGTPLADKLGKLIGNEYLIILSKEDKACFICLKLVNYLDELEHELCITKQKVVTLLESTYKLRFKDIVSANYSSEDGIYNQHDLIQHNNVSTKPENKIDDLEYKIEGPFTPTIPGSELKSPTHLESSIDIEVNLTSKPSDNSNLIQECSEESKKPHVPVLLKVEGFQEEPEEENGLLYSTEYIVRSGSDGNQLSNNSADLICAPIIEEPALNQEHKYGEIINNENTGGEVESDLSVKDKIFLCDICDIPFPKQYLLTRHKRVHQKNSKKVTCPLCNVECHDRLHYIYHRKNQHDLLNRLTCILCNKQFSSNKDLKNHIFSVHEGEEFNCTLCGKHFKRHNQFANHKLYAHGNRNCRICGKHISNDIKLRQHENRHAWIESKNLICDVCGRSFKTPGGLRVHKVSHTGNYKFFCEYCGRGFMSSVILEEHKGVHTREERYVCDICGRKFVLYSTFHLHKQWHKDPFPFPCRICKKRFKYRSVRSIHIRRDHTGESPYKCHYCQAEFLKAVSLKKHITSHTKEFSYNCNICFKGFVQRRNLARHMARIHNDNSFNQEPKICQYKVVLRPDEFPPSLENR